MKKIRKYVALIGCLMVFAALALGSGSDTSVDNSKAGGISDKTNEEKDNTVMVGGCFENNGFKSI